MTLHTTTLKMNLSDSLALKHPAPSVKQYSRHELNYTSTCAVHARANVARSSLLKDESKARIQPNDVLNQVFEQRSQEVGLENQMLPASGERQETGEIEQTNKHMKGSYLQDVYPSDLFIYIPYLQAKFAEDSTCDSFAFCVS